MAISREVRRRVYDRDRGRCVYCGDPLAFVEATLDHRTPRVLGGKTVDANLVLACDECNKAKGSRTEQEWLAMPKSERDRLRLAVRRSLKWSRA
jgi:5-methylcytosine-specific restriction endonuclease McrA